MSKQISIMAPRPLRRKSTLLLKENLDINPRCQETKQIGKNPFNLTSLNKEDEFVVEHVEYVEHTSLKMEKNKNYIRNSHAENVMFKNFEVDFFEFRRNLSQQVEDIEAREEILSILSTEINEFEAKGKNYIRSSMPPLRPANPFLKNFTNEENCKTVGKDYTSVNIINSQIPILRNSVNETKNY
jgi:hypothetical protein